MNFYNKAVKMTILEIFQSGIRAEINTLFIIAALLLCRDSLKKSSICTPGFSFAKSQIFLLEIISDALLNKVIDVIGLRPLALSIRFRTQQDAWCVCRRHVILTVITQTHPL